MAAFEMLWSGKSVYWEFQKPVGPFFLDFAIPKAKIAVEVDGGYHLDPKQMAYDTRRTEYLENHGWTVLRFTNDRVHTDIAAVVREVSKGFGLTI